MLIYSVLINFLLYSLVNGSMLTRPPQSALIIAFEKTYEQSLLAYTLSDQNIDSTLIIASASDHNDLYENLLGIEVLKLNSSHDTSPDKAALNACESLLSDQNILTRVKEIQPTFVIFPAMRHDACLLPWTAFLKSIPVITSYGYEEDLYTVQRSQIALPIQTGGLWSGFWANADSRSVIAYANSDYVAPAWKLAKRYIPELEIDLDRLYSGVELFFSSADTILRSDFALLNQQPINIGCHHCRSANPLPAALQKELVEFRSGTIVVTLDKSFASFVQEIARKLPQGRQGLAVAWKRHEVDLAEGKKPENLFIHGEVDRQDLLGYARARVLLSHCEEVELLETVFHGTPVICFPRNFYERKNAQRTIDLGFGASTDGGTSVDAIVALIDIVHKSTEYREIARSFSLLIRDRPLPASDRLIYWLDYMARNIGRAIKLPVLRASTVRTFAGDSQFLSGFLFGTIVGTLLALGAIITWFKTKNNQKKIRKDQKFNR